MTASRWLWSRVPKLLVGVTAASMVLLILSFVGFAWPGVDDLNRLRKGREFGPLQSLLVEYQFASGRWSAIGLDYVTWFFLDISWWYPTLLIAIFAVCLAAWFRLFRTLSENRLPPVPSLWAAVIFFVVYWAGMPRPSEVYNYAIAVENLLSVALSVILVTMLVNGPKRQGRSNRQLRMLGIGCMAFVIVGLHEIFGSILLLVLFLGTLQSWRLRRGNLNGWITALVGATLGMAVLLLAPGNQFRAARVERLYTGVQEVPVTLHLVAVQAKEIMVDWTCDLRLLSATLLLIALAPLSRVRWVRWPMAFWGLGVLLTLIAVLTLGLVLPAWFLGTRPPLRTLNGIYLLFLLCWLVASFLLGVRLARRFHLGERPAGRWFVLLAAFIFLAASGIPLSVVGDDPNRPTLESFPPYARKITRLSDFFKSNATKAIVDWRYRLWPYHRAVQRRLLYLENEAPRDSGVVVVEPLPTTPFLVRSIEISPQPRHGLNQSLAYLHDLPGLRVPDATNNEYFVGPGEIGELKFLGPSREEVKVSYPLFRNLNGARFLLRPTPAGAEAATAVLNLPFRKTAVRGVTARATLNRKPRIETRVSLFFELWTDHDAGGQLVGRTQVDFGFDDGFIHLELMNSKTDLAFLSILVSASTSEGAPLMPLIVDRLELIPGN